MIEEKKTFEQRKEDLIKKGKEKGFITYEELANGLKGLDLHAPDGRAAARPAFSPAMGGR